MQLMQPDGNVKSKWFSRAKGTVDGRVRLFCFPYAGGGSSIYRRWQEQIGPDIEVICAQLPGRQMRRDESPLNRFDELLPRLADHILPFLDRPFAFFGHSMGALLAFELTNFLFRYQCQMPVQLHLSAASAPHMDRADRTIHTLPDTELIRELRRLNGTPAELLANREAMEFFLPTIRADFSVIGTYTYRRRPPLPVPVHVYGGRRDEIDSDQLSGWGEHTSAGFSLTMLDGDHFFIDNEETMLPSVVGDALRERIDSLHEQQIGG